MKSKSTTQELLVGTGIVIVMWTLWLLWNQLPDAQPARLRQDCKENLEQIYLALITIGEADEKETSVQTRLAEYFAEHSREYNLRCPGADSGEQEAILTNYLINPNLDPVKVASHDYRDDLILICDRIGNHRNQDGELINFLLADGSVVARNISKAAYKQWISAFQKGTPDAVYFPVAGLVEEP